MQVRTGLNALLWGRISEVLSEQGRPFSDLSRIVERNKNTYTNWRNGRTMPTISDLEEIAEALGVAPADLLRASEGNLTGRVPRQMELPFEPGRKGAKLELESTQVGFVIRLISRTA